MEAVLALLDIELAVAVRVPYHQRLRAPRRDVEPDDDQLEDGRRQHRREHAPGDLDAQVARATPGCGRGEGFHACTEARDVAVMGPEPEVMDPDLRDELLTDPLSRDGQEPRA